jgi:hypothetical protein
VVVLDKAAKRIVQGLQMADQVADKHALEVVVAVLLELQHLDKVIMVDQVLVRVEQTMWGQRALAEVRVPLEEVLLDQQVVLVVLVLHHHTLVQQ